jgi:dUTP pyrophosphatase
MDFCKVRKVKSPEYGTSGSAGIDFFVPECVIRVVAPGESALIPSGIKVNLPHLWSLIAFNKSGVATKKRLQVGAAVVDSDYQGEIHLHVFNVGNESQTIRAGDKLVQFVCIFTPQHPLTEVDNSDLFEQVTERGAGGFGSTGTF